MLDSKILRSIATTSSNSSARDTETTRLNPGLQYTLQISHFPETSDIASFKSSSFIPALETSLLTSREVDAKTVNAVSLEFSSYY